MNPVPPGSNPLRLLSFNMQAGTTTRQYREYLTQSWRQVLPNRKRMQALEQLAGQLEGYDVVAIQEADAGSLRSGFLNQTQYLAEKAGYAYCNWQSNRRVGAVAHVSNGLLSRHEPVRVEDHKLPGRIPGRGALLAIYGSGAESLAICVVHLSLGKRSRQQQFDYLAEILADYPNRIVMGDTNCPFDSPEMLRFISRAELAEPLELLPTYPAWAPDRAIDHILVSHHLPVLDYQVLPLQLSDHLPVTIEIDARQCGLEACSLRS